MATNNSMPAAKTPLCYPPMPAVSNGILQGDMPLNFALPLLTVQIAVVILVTRSMGILFKPIKQPRVLAEIIGGVLLGPTALGRNKFYMERVFPPQSMPLLETVATIGLMFFIFMVGLELDLQALRKTGRKALLISFTGIAVPFVASAGIAPLVRSTISKGVEIVPLILFMGGPISISAFSVLVRIMGELKILTTDMGKLAIPCAAVNDVTIWNLLAIGVAISGSKHNPLTPIWVLLCGAVFGLLMFTVVRMFMTMVAHRATRGGQVTDIYVCITLMGVLLAGFFSDAVGVHPLFGPFLLGLVIPKDNPFPKMITEKIEDFVTGLLLPLFFASSGLKTNLGTLHGAVSLGFLLLFFATAAIGKITGSFVAARLIGLPPRKALMLGFLMNTKGLAVLIVLNIGRDLKALTDELFAILVLTCLLTSFVTTPVVTALCKPEASAGARGDAYHRSVESVATKKHLRILACAHETRHHAAVVNLLEASRGAKSSPLKLYTLRLFELSDRPSAILMLAPPSQEIISTPDQTMINIVFQASPQLSKVVVRPLTAISKVDSMHEDICDLAMQKRAAIILLPYQKPPHNMFEPGFHKVHQKVLDHAPCSVGILVDRGSMGASPIHPCFFSYKVVVLFVGGPDDREALALGSRMVDHPGVALKLVRLISMQLESNAQSGDLSTGHLQSVDLYDEDGEHEEDPSSLNIDHSTSQQKSTLSHVDATVEERLLDDEAIFKLKEQALESSFVYEEEQIAGGQSLIEAVKAIIKEMKEVNMFIVGRGRFRPGLSRGQTDQQGDQCSELGEIGDELASAGPDFHACILVVQQHLKEFMEKLAKSPSSNKAA